MGRTQQFDFDFIVIGSGFGGSVSAHRLAEKGYRVAVMEMGRRWTPDNLPRTSWSIHRWFWRPKLGLRGFFNMRFFRHATIFHGCAVGGGSITYASTLLPPPTESMGNGLLDWVGRLESGNAPALRNRRANARRHGKQNPWTCRPSPEESGGSRGVWAYFLPHAKWASSSRRMQSQAKPSLIHSSAEKVRRGLPASPAAAA